MSVTADTVRYTADAHYPTADGFVPGVSPAVVVEAAAAADFLDAKVKAASGGGFGVIWRPLPVEGVGFGILPELEGEAHGTVYIGADGFAVLPLVGEAHGVVDDVDDLLLLMLLAA